MYRGGLDRFRKAETLEPFSVSKNAASKGPSISEPQPQTQTQASPVASQQPSIQIGGGQSTWQPPDWAIDPRPGVYYLDVVKDGQVLDRINLDKRRHIFGRQKPTCDFVLDHLSVSRQHAAIVPHRNGSIFVVDLGSVHGTFVANERLKKEIPVELEVGQSVRFAASTRTYILRKNTTPLFPKPIPPAEINLSLPPDPSDEEAVLTYNTTLNRFGLTRPDRSSESGMNLSDNSQSGRHTKRRRRLRVAFRDQVGGELVQVVGISDGADVETEPGPVGVKEGSLVGKYESLVHVTVIPKGKEHASSKEEGFSPKGVTDKLQQALNRVKGTTTGRTGDGLYGDIFSGGLGSSWAYSSSVASSHSPNSAVGSRVGASKVEDSGNGGEKSDGKSDPTFGDDDEDDLFGN